MKTNPDALKVIRERTGLTISGLSRASGVDRTVITRLENGERRGTPAQITSLAKALEVSVLAITMAEVA